jgi:hypothetical protein
MPDYAKVGIYSAAVGFVAPFVVKMVAKLPALQITLSTVEVNIRNQYGAFASQSGTIGGYLSSLIGNPLGEFSLMPYITSAIGAAILGIGGYMLADQLGLLKNKAAKAIVPLALATFIAGVVIIPIMGGAKLGLAIFSKEAMILGITMALGTSVITGLYYLAGDPLELIPN